MKPYPWYVLHQVVDATGFELCPDLPKLVIKSKYPICHGAVAFLACQYSTGPNWPMKCSILDFISCLCVIITLIQFKSAHQVVPCHLALVAKEVSCLPSLPSHSTSRYAWSRVGIIHQIKSQTIFDSDNLRFIIPE